MITLIPQGGLGNRMMTIASAIAFARQQNKPLRIIWHRDRKLNCTYRNLFKPIDSDRVYLEDIKKLPLKFTMYVSNKRKIILFPVHLLTLLLRKFRYAKTEAYLTYKNFESVKNKQGNILIQSSSKFLPYENLGDIFYPTDALAEIINTNTKGFATKTIGLHIRRTDHVISIRESPLELFFEAIEKEIATDADIKFYLATDSYSEKEVMLKKYGEHIITRQNILERKSEEGITEALIDLYSLSKTQKIYGSSWSSFSEVAANLGQIPNISLKVNKEN